jgi:hypothetical protein
MSELRERLEKDLGEVEWEQLSPHLKRDALIVVDASLDLVEVAVSVSEDDSGRVGKWVAANMLVKPTKEQATRWSEEPKKLFTVLIAKPFVLMQLPRQ